MLGEAAQQLQHLLGSQVALRPLTRTAVGFVSYQMVKIVIFRLVL